MSRHTNNRPLGETVQIIQEPINGGGLADKPGIFASEMQSRLPNMTIGGGLDAMTATSAAKTHLRSGLKTVNDTYYLTVGGVARGSMQINAAMGRL